MRSSSDLIYVPMQNFVDATAIQQEEVQAGHTGTITYTYDELTNIRENCKQDNRFKILGYDKCKNIRKL